MPWLREFELAESIDNLQTSVSNTDGLTQVLRLVMQGLPSRMDVKITWDDIQGFDTRCDAVLLSKKEMPQDHILESLCKMMIRGFEELKTVLTLHDQDIYQKDTLLSCQKSKKNW